jgi:hypothetical protein
MDRIMTLSLVAQPQPHRSPQIPIAGWTFAFWLFNYVLQSALAGLSPTAPGLLSESRLVATAAGALCFGLVLHWIRTVEHRLGASLVAVILSTILPASLFVLAARLVNDVLVYGEVRDINRDLRFAMTWAGYFGLWVSAALALQWERCRAVQVRRDAVAQARAAAETVVVAPVVAAQAASSLEAWESAIDALADELSMLPVAARSDLAKRLSERAGYELADDWTGGAHNRRAEVMRRIATRLEGSRTR